MAALTPDVLISYYETVDPAFDPPPLRDLKSVDWSSLTHAHGKATDVPALLRALMSDEPDHRDFALQLLCETIWHQGDIYEATAATVPFLYNLLEADGPHDKASIAHLLAMIADGLPPFARCEGNPKEMERWQSILSKKGRSLEVEMARGRKYTEEVRRRLVSQFDLLYPFLRHSDPEVRRSVAVAVGHFPEVAARVLPDLEAALRDESDKYVREALQEVIERQRKSSAAKTRVRDEK